MESPARAREAAPVVGGDELAEGLMLVRASTLKMVRLQLAMERHDRRLALEAVDDLVDLDRQLEQYLDEVPALHERNAQMRELEVERAALNREKLTLAAGVVRREPAPVIEPEDAEVAMPDAAWDEFAFAPEERRGRRVLKYCAILFVLLAVIAGTAWMLVGPEMLASTAARLGVLR